MSLNHRLADNVLEVRLDGLDHDTRVKVMQLLTDQIATVLAEALPDAAVVPRIPHGTSDVAMESICKSEGAPRRPVIVLRDAQQIMYPKGDAFPEDLIPAEATVETNADFPDTTADTDETTPAA